MPLQQHPAYGLALAEEGANCLALCWGPLDAPDALCLVVERRLFSALDLSLIFRGPVWLKDIAAETQSAAHKALKAFAQPWRWRFVVQMPEVLDESAPKQMLRRAGLRRVMTGFATSWVSLDAPEIMRTHADGKWRNQLKKAEKAGLTISMGGKRDSSYAWLLDKEAGQREARAYHAVPLGLVPAYKAAAASLNVQDSVISVTALDGRDKVAGALFLCHGRSATYHIGWTSDHGRTINAQNLVLFEGLKALQARGVRHLDMGGMNTAALAGIARFKLGLGGTVAKLTGSYI